MRNVIIAGPTCGKSTLAALAAKEIDMLVFDTDALWKGILNLTDLTDQDKGRIEAALIRLVVEDAICGVIILASFRAVPYLPSYVLESPQTLVVIRRPSKASDLQRQRGGKPLNDSLLLDISLKFQRLLDAHPNVAFVKMADDRYLSDLYFPTPEHVPKLDLLQQEVVLLQILELSGRRDYINYLINYLIKL